MELMNAGFGLAAHPADRLAEDSEVHQDSKDAHASMIEIITRLAFSLVNSAGIRLSLDRRQQAIDRRLTGEWCSLVWSARWSNIYCGFPCRMGRPDCTEEITEIVDHGKSPRQAVITRHPLHPTDLGQLTKGF